MNKTWDVMVIGCGPAGLAAAAECAERGLSTLVLAPKPEAPWEAVYGVWPSSLSGLDLGDPFERYWDDAVAILDAKRSHTLGAPYAKLHNARIKARLEARIHKCGGEIRDARVSRIEHHTSGSHVVTHDAEVFATRLVIDASGARSRFLERLPMRGATTLQDTYGIMGRVKKHPFDPAKMVLMDYRADWLDKRSERATTPTFLYAMPISHERLFVEETSIVQDKPISTEIMKARLDARLRSLGIEFEEEEFRERGRIDMASPMPVHGQRTIGFGAAANMVHPATAWHVGLALKTAPELGRVIAGALGGDGASPDMAAQRAWDVVWPKMRRQLLPFHLMGGAILCDTTMDEQREFLDAFFRTAKEAWGPFATWELDVRGMQKALSPVFGAGTLAVKKRMITASVRHMLRKNLPPRALRLTEGVLAP